MFRTSWWTNRRASQAAKCLQRALLFVESAAIECKATQDERALPTGTVRRAKACILSSRTTIEELATLSFTAQCRFFRLFEWLEECLDYAVESMVYEDPAAAGVDLCRSTRGIQEAIALLNSQTGAKPHKPIFPRIARRLAMRTHSELRASPKSHAQVFHLPFAKERKEQPAPKTRAILM